MLIGEYELARTRRILRPRFCGIHCTALGGPQFQEWEQIVEDIDVAEDVEGEENGTIVWSPFSNLWLTATPPVSLRPGTGACACASAPTGGRRGCGMSSAS